MDRLNAHEIVGSSQTMYWNEWPEGQLLEFELIDYFRSNVYPEGNGHYQIYYAIARKDNATLGIRDGDDILLHISYKGFVKTISRLPTEYKLPAMKKTAEGKNLFIRIEKVNSKSMKLHYQEVREPTEQNKEDADKYYKLIEMEHRIKQYRKNIDGVDENGNR